MLLQSKLYAVGAKIDSVFFDDLFSYRFDSKQFTADETDLIFFF